MSRRSTSFVLAYHGCEEKIGKRVIEQLEAFQRSEKAYDWLGPGVYFWESDPRRALEWAQDRITVDSRAKPYVVGAVLDLGNCLDLTLRENVELLRDAYQDLARDSRAAQTPIPKNRDPRSVRKGDKLLRFRDCAVIKRLHTLRELLKEPPFDTVRGLFIEGKPAYPGARFYDKSHTQIAVLSPSAIREIFVPRPD